MNLWRLCLKKHDDDPLSGKGGLYVNGRWHDKGVQIVYTSDSPSLAQLEILANNPTASFIDAKYDLFHIQVDKQYIMKLELSLLKQDWVNQQKQTQNIGNAWIRMNSSAALVVPSAVSPSNTEANILINPNHDDFNKLIKSVKKVKYSFDPRICT
ncbi:MAG: RES family NAD+ phosphorylase [Proteobacteria bacterium]|nr:RES family NAD+ phosphorylase [Pseudomonadota bacterium]